MSYSYAFTDADLTKVVDATQYDKQPFIKLKGFTYYSYSGRTLTLTTRYDLRPSLVFGVAITEEGIVFHVPQYQKKLKVKLAVANQALAKSRLYYSTFYEEV